MKNWITAALLVVAASSQATTVWQETSPANDLSNNHLAPTPLAMTVGHNVVLGTIGNTGSGIDRDYFRFDVPVGSVLEAIVLLPNTAISGGASFLGVQAGPQVTVPHNTNPGAAAAVMYGFMLYDDSHIGTNVLPALAFGSSPVPAPAGTYSVWIQETSAAVPYGLDFVITAVPEPTTALTLGLGLFGLVCRRFVLQRR